MKDTVTTLTSRIREGFADSQLGATSAAGCCTSKVPVLEKAYVDPNRQRIKSNASGELYIEDGSGRATRLYRFREALDRATVSAATYYVWVKRGVVPDTRLRDQGKWRVFTESELRRLIATARKEGQHTAPISPWEEALPESRDSEWRE